MRAQEESEGVHNDYAFITINTIYIRDYATISVLKLYFTIFFFF